MDSPERLAKDALSEILQNITDQVFLEIQENRDLMQRYLRLLGEKNVEDLNSEIGKIVKQRLELENSGREEDPVSTLIKSYEVHSV